MDPNKAHKLSRNLRGGFRYLFDPPSSEYGDPTPNELRERALLLREISVESGFSVRRIIDLYSKQYAHRPDIIATVPNAVEMMLDAIFGTSLEKI